MCYYYDAEGDEMIKQAFQLFSLIENNSGKNAKLDILRQGQVNETFKQMLYLTYNSFITFGVKKIPVIKDHPKTPNDDGVATWNWFIRVLDKLGKRELTGNAAKNELEQFFRRCNAEEYKWYGKVMQKDLKIGIDVKSINAAMTGFIPTFDCQLAEKCDRYPKRSIIDPKFDGIRVFGFREGRDVVLCTRNGKQLFGYEKIAEELKQCPDGFVYDGEIVDNDFNGTIQQFMRKNVTKDGLYNLFDAIPIDHFKKGFSPHHQIDRRTWLYDEIDKALPSITVVQHFGIFDNSDNSVDAINKMYNSYLNLGFEGLMLKDAEAPYDCKRGRNWQKIKPEETHDVSITGYYEGEGAREGMLGGFICDFEGNEVRVGGGFNAQRLVEFWENRESMVGRIIEVKCQNVSTNQDGGRSLRFPVFKRFRDDK